MARDRFIEIRKNSYGRWIVTRDDPDRPFERGSKVTWELRGGKSISAHFQFTDGDAVEDFTPGKYAITPDWTAVIAEGGKALVLKIRRDAYLPLSKRHYAVWICDPEIQGFGGMYAVGESQNPPPEIDLGP
ncbi:MAG: hypothetical protein AMJ46_04060 [Latescibacteria bacterium DG_63]|nr:MAG: hypothetical protein AMJ46_04060 [Latescibacteria bacterium DG_63]